MRGQAEAETQVELQRIAKVLAIDEARPAAALFVPLGEFVRGRFRGPDVLLASAMLVGDAQLLSAQ